MATGHRVACHAYDTVPQIATPASGRGLPSKFTERLAAFEAAKARATATVA